MHPAIPAVRQPGTLAIAILGADAMLAALPATPVQVAHACLAAGYDLAIPASWGDELLAAECLQQLADRGPRPAVMCACPLVRSELLAVGPDLAPMLVPLVSPPVAVARYLHALYGRARIRLTYMGDCPGAHDDAIESVAGVGEFLSSLEAADISLTDQPRVFDSVIPPDRRRFFSVAGGAPSAEQLWSIGNGRSLVELDGEDYLIDLAQHLLSHECILIDLAPRLGCACSGASAAIPARSARAAVAVIEPPRAASAVVDVSIAVDVLQPIESLGPAPEHGSAGPGAADELSDDEARDASSSPVATRTVVSRGAGTVARRRRAAGVRSVRTAVPTTHVAGRTLPRAYIARRRPSAAVEEPAQPRPVTRLPSPGATDTDEQARLRQSARVAAAARTPDEQRTKPMSIAAGATGAPEKMSDGPRT